MEPRTDTNTEIEISQLIKDLGASDYLKRQRARLVLIHREQESVPALRRALKSSNQNTRWEAVRALGEIHDPETIPALIDMLEDQSTSVRWAAMESLIRMGRICLHPLLEKFTKNFDSLWLREGLHHILHVLKDRHQLNQEELALFETLDEHVVPGFESNWTSNQAWAAEKALEILDQKIIQ